MIRYIFSALLLLLASSTYAQNIQELEKRNGFKDIELGSMADSVKGSKVKKEFKEKDLYPAKLYTVEHPDYEKIGEVRVKEIELKSYKDLIYEIKVLTDKDPRLMKALESLFGKADYDMKNQLYFWKSDRIILKFKATGKNFLELEYSSPVVRNMMKDDKEQKVDDIANDL
ncbi:hypothetical protein [Ohtaekwangia koreensis]|uniref:Intein N-terminal splicing region n=1 Tax=Ohtaekwangia koreensis TaxID=688867 RepID=A0A1T5K814_9BACT|nr:hypothetical protein [Ohtaekwangia koreensis]SKC59764.1 hypothetical protein SAMN05660236_1903 [Ohtaekwangia koreensis]